MTGSTEVKLSGDELQALRKQLEEQEVLIRGYQAADEAAVRKIKVGDLAWIGPGGRGG